MYIYFWCSSRSSTSSAVVSAKVKYHLCKLSYRSKGCIFASQSSRETRAVTGLFFSCRKGWRTSR